MNVPKFRAWNVEKKEWESMTLIELKPDGSLFHLYDEEVIYQQYTGLKDKNGKEIFEGDLVKVNQNHEAWVLAQLYGDNCPDYSSGEIKWLCESWKICEKGLGSCPLTNYMCCYSHPAALEIVGNIFEK